MNFLKLRVWKITFSQQQTTLKKSQKPPRKGVRIFQNINCCKIFFIVLDLLITTILVVFIGNVQNFKYEFLKINNVKITFASVTFLCRYLFSLSRQKANFFVIRNKCIFHFYHFLSTTNHLREIQRKFAVFSNQNKILFKISFSRNSFRRADYENAGRFRRKREMNFLK